MSIKSTGKFVKELCATFHKYPISDEVKQQMMFRLSKYKLSDDHWQRVLGIIVESRKEDDRGLPEPPEIIAAIKTLRSEKAREQDYGHWRFMLGNQSYVIRCVNRDGRWVSIATGLPPVIPSTATDRLFCPNRPADPSPEEMPNTAEIHAYVQAVVERIAKRMSL